MAPSEKIQRTRDPGKTARKPGKRSRPKWLIALAVVVLLLGGLATTAALLAPRLGRHLVKTRVLPALEKRFARKIRVKRMQGGLTRLVLEDVTISGPRDCPGHALMRAERITLTYDFWPLLRGRLALKSLTVHRPRFCMRRLADGTDNVSDLLRKLARKRLHRRVKLKLSEVRMDHGSLEGIDELRHVRLKAPELNARLVPGGQSRVDLERVWIHVPHLVPAQARRLAVTFRTRLGRFQGWPTLTVTGGRLRLHDKLVLTDIGGRITAADGWVSAKLQGGYGQVEQTLWKASGRARLRGLLDPRRAQATLKLDAQRFSLDKLAPILPKKRIPDPSQARLSAKLHLALKEGHLTFDGQAALSGLTLQDPYLSPSPVEGLGFEGHIKGDYLLKQDLLRIQQARLRRRRLQIDLKADVLRLRGEPRIKVAVTIPRTRCSNVLDAIPKGMAPHLQKLRVAGWFDMKVEAEADFHYLTTSSVYLAGKVNARRCRVTAVGWELSAARLAGAFGHEVEDGGKRFGFEVGPQNPDFVPLDQISPHLQKAILTTEDSRFFYHHGFIPREFETALARNLIARRFKYGASSITMQMVKNVLLGREKTLSRKLEELILTWYLEKHLSKKRIFEIYLNVIEFGPGIFGIGRAAWHLFGKDASALDPQEAAYLASILPSPKRRYKMFCAGKVYKRWRGWVNRILRIMHKRHRLNKSELELALMSPIQFSEKERGTYAECMARLDRFRPRNRRR